MTRRYPDLPQKVLKRDSEIARRLIHIWDEKRDGVLLLNFFLDNMKNLSDQRYWEVLRTVWVLTGSNDNADLFRRLFTSSRKHRYFFSSPEDAKALRDMPDEIVVFRAGSDNDKGLSWTTSEQYAIQYKDAFFKEKIIQKTVNKKDVFAFIQRNKESEIIIL